MPEDGTFDSRFSRRGERIINVEGSLSSRNSAVSRQPGEEAPYMPIAPLPPGEDSAPYTPIAPFPPGQALQPPAADERIATSPDDYLPPRMISLADGARVDSIAGRPIHEFTGFRPVSGPDEPAAPRIPQAHIGFDSAFRIAVESARVSIKPITQDPSDDKIPPPPPGEDPWGWAEKHGIMPDPGYGVPTLEEEPTTIPKGIITGTATRERPTHEGTGYRPKSCRCNIMVANLTRNEYGERDEIAIHDSMSFPLERATKETRAVVGDILMIQVEANGNPAVTGKMGLWAAKLDASGNEIQVPAHFCESNNCIDYWRQFPNPLRANPGIFPFELLPCSFDRRYWMVVLEEGDYFITFHYSAADNSPCRTPIRAGQATVPPVITIPPLPAPPPARLPVPIVRAPIESCECVLTCAGHTIPKHSRGESKRYRSSECAFEIDTTDMSKIDISPKSLQCSLELVGETSSAHTWRLAVKNGYCCSVENIELFRAR